LHQRGALGFHARELGDPRGPFVATPVKANKCKAEAKKPSTVLTSFSFLQLACCCRDFSGPTRYNYGVIRQEFSMDKIILFVAVFSLVSVATISPVYAGGRTAVNKQILIERNIQIHSTADEVEQSLALPAAYEELKTKIEIIKKAKAQSPSMAFDESIAKILDLDDDQILAYASSDSALSAKIVATAQAVLYRSKK
jgi:hypothetical protein